MATPDAGQQQQMAGATGIAVALLFGAWCVPTLASSGISAQCEELASPLPETTIATTTPTLASHTESALQDKLADEPVQMPALADAATRSVTEELEEGEIVEETAIQNSEIPAISPRLPGVSNAALPGFRRQMLRTDI